MGCSALCEQLNPEPSYIWTHILCLRLSHLPAWWTRCAPLCHVSSWTGTPWVPLRRSHCGEETTWSWVTWRTQCGGLLNCSAGLMRLRSWWGVRKHWWVTFKHLEKCVSSYALLNLLFLKSPNIINPSWWRYLWELTCLALHSYNVVRLTMDSFKKKKKVSTLMQQGVPG